MDDVEDEIDMDEDMDSEEEIEDEIEEEEKPSKPEAFEIASSSKDTEYSLNPKHKETIARH